MVVAELRGEKIDIIPWNDEPARFVAKALAPARVREVLVDDENEQATVIVPDDQLSLAIGRDGQNARLATRLTGWRDRHQERDRVRRGGGRDRLLGRRGRRRGRRSLRRDPRLGPALSEQRAPGLALLRHSGAPRARGARRGTRLSPARTRAHLRRLRPSRTRARARTALAGRRRQPARRAPATGAARGCTSSRAASSARGPGAR